MQAEPKTVQAIFIAINRIPSSGRITNANSTVTEPLSAPFALGRVSLVRVSLVREARIRPGIILLSISGEERLADSGNAPKKSKAAWNP
jgi:hypothetical protein